MRHLMRPEINYSSKARLEGDVKLDLFDGFPLGTHATPKRKHLPAYSGRTSKLMVLWKGGAACVTRTRDPIITNLPEAKPPNPVVAWV